MTKRARTADIAQVGAMIFQRPGAAPAAAPDGTPAPARAGVPGGSPAQHPATAGGDRRTRRDVFDLDPRRILEQGPYIREWDEAGEAFERLVAAVGARGEVDTPIWVRSRGAAGQRVFVLVAGKGRLRAALRNKLPLVPVRDLGELTDQEAVARQVEENLNRQDMTPAQTAHAFWLSHRFGESVSDIGRRLHRDKGYVSYMVRVGEALDSLSPAEQAALARRGALQVRQCQAIGALADVASRAAELRRVLAAAPTADRSVEAPADAPNDTRAAADGASPGATAAGGAGAGGAGAEGASAAPNGRGARPTRRADEEAAFYSRAIRGGRTFRVRWMEQELRAEPLAVANAFVGALQAEGARMIDALRRLEAERGAGEGRDEIARARRALERFIKP